MRLSCLASRRARETDFLRVDPAEYLALDLEAHALLRGVPLRDVSVVDLPGGGEGRKVADAKRLLFASERRGLASRALFGFRFWLGRVFGWDRPVSERLYSDARVPDALRRRSLVPTGTRDGLFRVLYELPREALGEVRNATVHGFVCSALVPRAGGHRFYFAVYVAPVSRFTPLYMAAIEPFRRFVIYPAMLARLRAAWQSAYPQT
ncbi:MAG TPA: DUF2867 domain-containing protein [Myxococcota bacterium]|nr:DUF2867 domain-containing protein [Myxococcota bacterium]